jgi:hypothetical protein
MRLQSNALAILLTAAIRPNPQLKGLATIHWKERLASYNRSLTIAATVNMSVPIIFVEGSRFLETEEGKAFTNQFAAKNVSFVSAVPEVASADQGKGRLELDLINAAVNSEPGRHYTHFWKITGRYTVRNIPAIIADITADHWALCGIYHKDLQYMDSRVFGMSRQFFAEYLWPRRGQISDNHGVYLEHVLARAAHALQADRPADFRYPQVWPAVSGVSGATGKEFGASRLRYLFNAVGYFALLRLMHL